MAAINELVEYTKNLSLLYIEEDEKLLCNVSNVLKKIFLRVDDADNANDGIGFVKFNSYDIVILDSVSSIMDSEELIQTIKSIQPTLRIIVTVKNHTDKQLVNLYKLGVFSIVNKPFGASSLLDELLVISSSLAADRAYLEVNVNKLKKDIAYEKKRIGRLLLNEKKYKTQIEYFQNNIHVNKDFHELTKLPTRYILQKLLGKSNQSLLYINIDHFDFVNSVYGMGSANKLLKGVGEQLNTFLPSNAQLFHITADEFVILIDDPAEQQAFSLAKQIQALFKEAAIEFDGYSQYIAFSIGIDTGLSKILFVNAKSASKEARTFGGDQVIIYSSSSPYVQEQRENLYWIKVLKLAFDEDKIFTYYQPIINNKEPEKKHYEVLCRLKDENDKLVDANKFIKSAKLVGLITQITRTVVDKTFKAFQNNDYDFSINISRYDLHEEYLADFLDYKCEKYNISKDRIYLEIIEDIITSEFDFIDKQIVQLKGMGYHVIVDDFGSNKSTFSRMFDLQVDFIKIDGSLIRELDKNKSYQIIVQSIVDFSKRSGIKTIAEHVESREILKIVSKLGIDYSQGYLLGRPSLNLE